MSSYYTVFLSNPAGVGYIPEKFYGVKLASPDPGDVMRTHDGLYLSSQIFPYLLQSDVDADDNPTGTPQVLSQFMDSKSTRFPVFNNGTVYNSYGRVVYVSSSYDPPVLIAATKTTVALANPGTAFVLYGVHDPAYRKHCRVCYPSAWVWSDADKGYLPVTDSRVRTAGTTKRTPGRHEFLASASGYSSETLYRNAIHDETDRRTFSAAVSGETVLRWNATEQKYQLKLHGRTYTDTRCPSPDARVVTFTSKDGSASCTITYDGFKPGLSAGKTTVYLGEVGRWKTTI